MPERLATAFSWPDRFARGLCSGVGGMAMMTRVAVTDFVEGSLLDELDEELAALDFEFSKWENAAGEGTRQL